MLLWLFLGGLVLMLAFGLSSYYAVSNIVRSVESDEEVFTDSGDLAVLEVKGVIMDSEETLRKIREIEDKDEIKAVVVRIDSPGGAVGPSQEIYDAIKRLSEEVAVVCSFGDIAASGGYYIASACEKIITNPGALTGSIGVIMPFMNLKDLYSWAKVDPFVIKAGKFKDIGSESRMMTEEEKRLMQEMIDQVHKQFKTAVEAGRHLPHDVVEKFADGRVFSGEQAVELGFADELGGEFEAIDAAAEMADIKEPRVVRENHRHEKITEFWESRTHAPAPQALAGLLQELTGNALTARLMPGVPYLLPAHFFGTAGPMASRAGAR